MIKKNEINGLESILKNMGYKNLEIAKYDNINCIVISEEEKRSFSTLDIQIYVVFEDEKIKVIGGDWIGYGSWEDFSKDELLEYENRLNKEKYELTQQKEGSHSAKIDIQNQLAEELMNKHHGVNTEDPESIFVACTDKKISSIGIRHIEFEIKLDSDGINFELSPLCSVLEDGIDENIKNELEQKAVSIFSDKISTMLEEIHSKENIINNPYKNTESKGIRATLERLTNLKFEEKTKEKNKKIKDIER